MRAMTRGPAGQAQMPVRAPVIVQQRIDPTHSPVQVSTYGSVALSVLVGAFVMIQTRCEYSLVTAEHHTDELYGLGRMS